MHKFGDLHEKEYATALNFFLSVITYLRYALNVFSFSNNLFTLC